MEDKENLLNYTFDDLFAAQAVDAERDQSEFNVEEWKAKKTEIRHKAFDMVDQAAIQAVSKKEQFQVFLDVWSRFGTRYSVNNMLLIYLQRPDAMELNSYSEWRMSGTPVKKNEPETLIITATPREDGKGFYYDAKKVFDVKQIRNSFTEEHKQAPVYDARTLMRALIDVSPVKIVNNDTNLDADEIAAYDEMEKTIHVRMGVKDPQELFRGLVHEIVLAHLFSQQETDDSDIYFLAASGAYLLCYAFGIEVPNGTYTWHDVRLSFGDLTATSVKSGLNRLKVVYDAIRLGMESRMKGKS